MIPAPASDNPRAPGEPQNAVLAGGCYWGVQGLFEHVKGVRQVIAGFTGRLQSSEDDRIGRDRIPAESVQITFDPEQISYGQILQIYFSAVHDPTQIDRQGPDSGPQYRSAIFYSDDSQQKITQAYIAQLEKDRAFAAPIATHVDWLNGFRRVDSSQQDYMLKHADSAYIVVNDVPRLAVLKRLFPDLYVDTPVTVAGGP